MTLAVESPEGSGSRAPLVSVQYLRAIAAVVVVYHHVFSNRLTMPYAAMGTLGVIGVDIFFVISGFLMWSTAGAVGGSIGRFVRRRAIRIYPAYWLALAAWVLVRLAIPDRLGNQDVTVQTLAFSALLVPHFHAVFAGQVWPILVPGWTLQFEVFFYAVFAACLAVPTMRMRAAAVFATIGLLVLLGLVLRPESAIAVTYTNPILIEFLAGVALALARPGLQRAGARAGLALVGAGLVAVALASSAMGEDSVRRVLTLGGPAVLFVAGGIALEARLALRPNRALLLLGDASYSLYLSHPLSMSVVAVAWGWLRLPVAGFAVPVLIGSEMLAAIAGGIGFYVVFELPLLRWAKSRRARAGAGDGAGALLPQVGRSWWRGV